MMVKAIWYLIKRNSFSTQWIVWMIVSLHLLWGLLLMFGPESNNVGGILWDVFINSGPREFWGLMFVVTALLSGVSYFIKRPFLALLMVLPQQFMLAAPAIDMIIHWSVDFHGEDNLSLWRHVTLVWSLFIFHMLAILDQYVYAPWKRFRYGT